MPQFLATTDPDFEARFAALLDQKRETDADVDGAVAAILADVAARGDAAVIALTERFDRVRLTPATLAFSAGRDRRGGRRPLRADDRAALELAASRIRAYHERQRPARRTLDRRGRRRARLALDRRSAPPASTFRAASPPTPPRC